MHTGEGVCAGQTGSHLDQLLLQLVDGEALPLLQDGQLRLLPVRGFVASKRVLLPLRHVVGHHADSSHVGGDLPAVGWKRPWTR